LKKRLAFCVEKTDEVALLGRLFIRTALRRGTKGFSKKTDGCSGNEIARKR
jgi:hypothetical protein